MKFDFIDASSQPTQLGNSTYLNSTQWMKLFLKIQFTLTMVY
jgi:hypothetical protein